MTADGIAMINDREVSTRDASISIFDLGFTRGYSVFELLRTYQGTPFHLDQHIDRLHHSANTLGLTPIPSKSEIRRRVDYLLTKSEGESIIRLMVAAGPSSDPLIPEGAPHLIIALTPHLGLPQKLYDEGIKLATTSHCRSFPEIKTTHYIPAIMAARAAQSNGFHDILFTSAENQVTESSTSNIFFIKDSSIHTPKGDLLEGITRQAVLEIVEATREVMIRDISVDELATFDEAFTTSSIKEIVPIVQIDNHKYDSARAGSLTQQLLKTYRQVAGSASPSHSSSSNATASEACVR